MRTKNVFIIGYPSVIFCTAGLKIDEQEATRFFLLSPEVNQDKIREAITQKIRKEADQDKFTNWLDELPERKLLVERIQAIKNERIEQIKISNSETIASRFIEKNKTLKPRHQRDIGRLLAVVKSLALLNLWWRERDGSTITANDNDIEQAFLIWEKMSVSQELNLPPYIYKLYQEVIMPIWAQKTPQVSLGGQREGISRRELLDKHYDVYGRMLDHTQLRQQILPMLETAGLIMQEADPMDKRKVLIYPTLPNTKINSDAEGGVSNSDKEMTFEEMVDSIPF
jgi:hypothetical protein